MATKTNQPRRTRKNDPVPEQVIIESFFSGLGQIIAWVFKRLTQGKAPRTNRQAELAGLQEHWENVELHVMQDATRALAVSEGDKILDSAFKIIGLPGESMGDRLKAAESKFSPDLYQQIWQAHKLRNTLAHEIGAKVSAQEAQAAITTFRQALYQLGVLS